VEEDEHQECVLEQRHAAEEPRLADDQSDDAVVHGISGKAIKTGYDEDSRSVDGCESALALGEEVPDAAKQDDRTGDGEDACTDRGRAELGETQTVRGAEYPEGNVAGYGAGQQQDEEDGP
jgi:hypothetical protein